MEQVSINTQHLSLEVLDYGARIHRLRFRTGDSTWQDVVVGLEEPETYLQDPLSRGACIGRFAGRLSGGVLNIDGDSFPVYNQKGVTLHGGERGFGKRYWEIISVQGEASRQEIRLGYKSAHLEEGFPGNLQACVTYRLEENALVIRHEAQTDLPTFVNMTNHAYFKIDRHPLISHYRLQLAAPQYLETDSRLLPTGRMLEVRGTDFDFQKEKPIGDLKLDTPFALESTSAMAAQLYSKISGIRMSVYTNQPGVVIFTPEGSPSICFETQNFPDAPKFGHFPSALLRPQETYINESRFVFDRD